MADVVLILDEIRDDAVFEGPPAIAEDVSPCDPLVFFHGEQLSSSLAGVEEVNSSNPLLGALGVEGVVTP